MLRRILLFIGITLVAMLLVITLVTRTVLMNGFSQLERTFLQRNLARVENAIFNEIGSLGMTTNDWATWDDTYQFIQDRNSRYVDSNLGADTFVNLRLEVVLFQDTRGVEVFSASYDPAKGLRQGIPASLRSWLARHPLLTLLADKASHVEGIIPLPEGALLAAARPILDSKRAGPVRGALLMGRFLDPPAVDRLSRNLMFSIFLSPILDQGMPQSQAMTPAGPLGGRLVSVDTRTADVISGTSVLQGFDGAPALLAKVEFPRDIQRQGEATSRYFILSLFLICVVFAAVVLLVIQRTVLSRLGQLSESVLAIGTGSEPGRRVFVKGRDQVAYLGAAINGMLEALEGSHDQLRQSELRNKAFLDAIPDLILRVARDGAIVDARFPPRSTFSERPDAYERATISAMAERFPFIPQKLMSAGSAAIAQALQTGLPVVHEFSLDAGKGVQHYEARIVASGDAEAIVLVREVTAEKRVEEAQRHEILVKEIHHRVKNNLQVISSLLGLQASAAGDPHARAMLDESRDRVRSMALIHERLYRAGEGSGGGYAEYVRDLAGYLLHSYMGDSTAVAVGVEADDVPMDMDQSVPVGLIINELLSNSLAHAFPQGRPGHITVRMRRIEGGLRELAVSDDGVGFPKEIDSHNPSTLGLRIVNILVQQIRGTLTLEAREGTTFLVTFPAG